MFVSVSLSHHRRHCHLICSYLKHLREDAMDRLPVNSSHDELVTVNSSQWSRHPEKQWTRHTVNSSQWSRHPDKQWTRQTVNSSQWIRHQKVKSSHSERVTAYLNTTTILSRSYISQYELIYQLIFPASAFSRLVGLHWLQTADFISLFCRTCLAPYCRAI